MKKNILFLLLPIAIATSCMEVIHESGPNPVNSEWNIPADFSFETSKKAILKIKTLDNHNIALSNVPVSVSFNLNGVQITLANLVTGKDGVVQFSNVVPAFIDTLLITTTYPGLPDKTYTKFTGISQEIILGGEGSPSSKDNWIEQKSISNGRTSGLAFTVKGAYDQSGVPQYLEPVNDYIPQDLLDLVNASLPERNPVPTANPQYISGTVNPDTRLKDKADVYITFVHEGAGYTNALGYYTYDINTPPTSVAEVKNLTIIYPNLSLPGSGGNLRPGSKVFLGTFEPNTAIGWFLIPNGWAGGSVVERPEIKYSTKSLNTFTSAAYRQHIVQLKDPAREILLLGMEDLSRPSGDNDFNDAVFFVTANPYSAIITDNVPDTKQPTGLDTDKDGVLDKNDKYPTDPDKAFEVFTPGENIYGSLAFEDQWPAKGDYDVNDLVIDYNYQFITNTSNAAVECRATFLVKAIGANYRNGYGFEMPIPNSMIQSVTSTLQATHSITSVNSNGTESNQSNAVFIVFENAHDLFKTNNFVNTRAQDQKFTPVQISMTIKFTEPVKLVDLGYAPFNAFIFVNGDRSREVHLPDNQPTNLADRTLLGTSADSSTPQTGRYYKAGNNLPWAIQLPVTFEYPLESRPIHETHLKFKQWAQSNGFQFKDWQLNKSGYRKSEYIYK